MDISNLREQFLSENLKILRRPTPRQENTPHIPILLKVMMAEERLTFPVFLKVSEGEKGDIKFLPYLEEGEILQHAWVESLQRAGIERLYFHEKDLDRVVAYLNNHLLLTSADPGNYREKLAKKSLENLTKFMRTKDFPWKLVWEMLHRDYTLYNHSVNVSLMGMSFMGFLGKSEKDSLHVGMAGLFHDVGLTHLKEEIVNKTEPLSQEEREILNRHPGLGYRLLKNNPEISVDSLRLILEHHESADGCGYPNGLPLQRQHPYTRVLFILEIYDGLTTFRPYRPAHTPFAALKILQEQQGSQGLACEPKTMKRFIQFLALA
jgi:HD-GYP domain-containing protein (c-di-GMP phosphodiesterase class II)